MTLEVAPLLFSRLGPCCSALSSTIARHPILNEFQYLSVKMFELLFAIVFNLTVYLGLI